jgi:hypothetical protein
VKSLGGEEEREADQGKPGELFGALASTATALSRSIGTAVSRNLVTGTTPSSGRSRTATAGRALGARFQPLPRRPYAIRLGQCAVLPSLEEIVRKPRRAVQGVTVNDPFIPLGSMSQW